MMHSIRASRLGVALISVACLVTGASCSSSKSARSDVKIASCKADPGGGKPAAAGTIVNHSSKTSAYAVHVKFYDSSGNAVGDGLSAVASVDPNTTARWDTKGSLDAKGQVTCKIDSVTRTESV